MSYYFLRLLFVIYRNVLMLVWALAAQFGFSAIQSHPIDYYIPSYISRMLVMNILCNWHVSGLHVCRSLRGCPGIGNLICLNEVPSILRTDELFESQEFAFGRTHILRASVGSALNAITIEQVALKSESSLCMTMSKETRQPRRGYLSNCVTWKMAILLKFEIWKNLKWYILLILGI